MTTEQRAMQWIVGPNVGISSRTIWSVMMGVEPDNACEPADPADFGRCWMLLALFPEWRKRLHEVAAKYPRWVGLVREWDKLDEMYTAIITAEGGWDIKASAAMFDFMQPLRDEGMLADGWTGGNGCWRKVKA